MCELQCVAEPVGVTGKSQVPDVGASQKLEDGWGRKQERCGGRQHLLGP